MVKMEEKNMPRRGENIYKRKDGRWEARYIYSFKEDGSPRYRSIYAADYLTVKKKQNDAKRKMDPRLFQSVRMKKNISLLWTALVGTAETFQQGIYLCKIPLSFQSLYQSYDW